MHENKYEQLIDPAKDQVFILQCPANIPINFAHHTWFVCNEKGKVSRWEVLHFPNKNKEWGYLHLNHFSPFGGIRMVRLILKYRWNSELLKHVEGDLAQRMIALITSSKETYPIDTYLFLSKNSNTYTQWILDNFKEELHMELSWRCIGKNAKRTDDR